MLHLFLLAGLTATPTAIATTNHPLDRLQVNICKTEWLDVDHPPAWLTRAHFSCDRFGLLVITSDEKEQPRTGIWTYTGPCK